MALNQTLAQLRENVLQFADVKGTTASARHPTATVNDYINRALGSLHRKLTEALPDQRFLSSSTLTTVASTSTYALPADFEHLISVDLTANGTKMWLVGYEMNERPLLTDPASSYTGIPSTYRLRGSNIELLPTPSAVYSGTLWYVPRPQQFTTTAGTDDAVTYDTIDRLDDYIVAYAARFIAVKDKKPDLVGICKGLIDELTAEILTLARSRDKNSPPRIVDEQLANRWGRRAPAPRRWR